MAVTNLGSGRNKIFIRGLSDGSFTGHTQSTVGLYLNDVPITYNAPDPDLRLADVDRVEVLRGPQGTLYGSGSIGGIVRIVTARPDPAGLAGAVSVEGMLTQHGAPSSGLEAMFNAPLAGGRAAVRAVAYSDERGGYIDNPVLGLRDVNYSRRSGARIAALAELSDGWTLEGGYAHQSIETADSQYTQGLDGPLTRDAAVREPHDNDFSEVSAQAVHAGDAADLKVSIAYIDHGLETRYDATGAFRAAGGSRTGGAFDETKHSKLLVAEGLLSSKAPGRLRWLAGAFASTTNEMDAAQLVGVSPLEPARWIYRRRDLLSEAAAYGEVAYDLAPRLTATVGGRWFATRVSTHAGVASARRRRPTGPDPRAAHRPGPRAQVSAELRRPFRPGGLRPDAGGLPGRRLQHPGRRRRRATPETVAARFKPDHLWSYELGASAAVWDHTLTLRGARSSTPTGAGCRPTIGWPPACR